MPTLEIKPVCPDFSLNSIKIVGQTVVVAPRPGMRDAVMPPIRAEKQNPPEAGSSGVIP
jgi:hypothetical protein